MEDRKVTLMKQIARLMERPGNSIRMERQQDGRIRLDSVVNSGFRLNYGYDLETILDEMITKLYLLGTLEP